MHKQFDELIESFINGNRTYVMDKIMSFQKKKIIAFFFYLENDMGCTNRDISFELLHSLNNRYNYN